MVEDFSPKQANKLIKIPASTIRYYARTYSDFLSDRANQPKRRYTGADLNLLSFVYELSGQGVGVDEIKKRLPSMVFEDEFIPPEDYTPEPDPEPKTQGNNYQIQPIEFFDAMLERIQGEHDKTIAAKDDYIKHLEDEIKRLSKPWYKRLFGE